MLAEIARLKRHALVVGDSGMGKTSLIKWALSFPPPDRTTVVLDAFGEYNGYVDYYGVLGLNPMELPRSSFLQALSLLAKAFGISIPPAYLRMVRVSKASSIGELVDEVIARVSALSYRDAIRAEGLLRLLELLNDEVFACPLQLAEPSNVVGVGLSEFDVDVRLAYVVLLYFRLLEMRNVVVVMDDVESYAPSEILPLLASLAKGRGMPVVFSTDAEDVVKLLIPKVEAIFVLPTTSSTVLSLLSTLMEKGKRDIARELEPGRPLLIIKGKGFVVERLSVGKPKRRTPKGSLKC